MKKVIDGLTGKIINKIITGCVLLIFSTGILAYEYRYALESTVRFSDNIGNSANAESGRSINAGYSFRVNTPSYNDWFTDISGRFVFEEFYTEISQSQKYKQLSGLVVYRPDTNNFSLRVLGDLSQTPKNRFAIESVDNLRDTRTTSVRPSYYFKLTSLDRINLDYARTDSVNDDIENDEGIINASRVTDEYTFEYERQLNSTQKLFATARKTETDFDALLSEGAVDDEQEEVLLRWVVLGTVTRLQFEYGVANIMDELGNDIRINPARFSFERQLSRRHSFKILASSGFDSEINESFSTSLLEVNNQSANFTRTQEVEEVRFNYDVSGDDLNFSFEVSDVKLADVLENNKEEQQSIRLSSFYSVTELFALKNNADIGISLAKTKGEFDTVLTQVSERQLELASLIYTHMLNKNTEMVITLEARREQTFSTGETQADSNSLSIGFLHYPRGKF